MKTFAALGAAMFALGLAMPAAGQDFVPGRGIYVGAGIGVNVPEHQDWKAKGYGLSGNADLTFETDLTGDFLIGWDAGPVRGDAEISIRQRDITAFNAGIDSFRIRGIRIPDINGIPLPIGGFERSIGIMGNLYYDFEFGSRFVPYVGGGAGVSFNTWKFKVLGFQETYESPLFAYQGIAGISYYATPNLSANLEYRYFGTTDGSSTFRGVRIEAGETANHSIMLGVRYTFGWPWNW